MDYFRLVAEGSQLAQPIEKIVATAAEAEAQSDALRRQCGKFGKVEVWGRDGRIISPERLHVLVQQEAAAGLELRYGPSHFYLRRRIFHPIVKSPFRPGKPREYAPPPRASIW